MLVWQKRAQRTAQRIVDAVMGNGLAQEERSADPLAQRTSANTQVAQLSRQAAAEGCVLLTNDGTLPLNASEEVAVFGRCQLDWFFMGHGSGGDVIPTHTVNLIDGLEQAGVTYNRVLAQMYKAWCSDEEHEAQRGWWGHWPTYYPEMPVAPDLAQAAAQTARTAVVVIGRAAGEDADMPLTTGGYYLSVDERSLLDVVTSAFERTVVVLNTTNVIDLSWLDNYGSSISAVLLAWTGGMESGNAVADVLYGTVNPSGRLAATIANDYASHPSSTSFGKSRVAYDEGVLVGYRHFDLHTSHQVLFPFGHGLSYTTFSTEICDIERTERQAIVRVRVTNTGEVAGARTVLLWCQPPKGDIEKPVRVLAAFGKTDVLDPDGSQELTLACDFASIASFDESTSSFVLEAGMYQFDCTHTATSMELPKQVVVERYTPLCANSEELRARIAANLPQEIAAGNTATPSDANKPADFSDVASGDVSLDEFLAQLSNTELEGLTCGEGLMNSELGTPGNAGALGGVTPALRKRGIPAAICADGPSGARLKRRSSLVPCATALACTWNADLVQRLYTALGIELREAGVDVLLAPGMNIQRDPRCGRNFEYFSEDPLATGTMATAVVRGLQSSGVSSCPKHFACNNQETRRSSSDSRVSERALREIYLRPFQMVVQAAMPDFIMTSYNKINGVWGHYHYDLATTVLRGDWGFAGVVLTDWWMRPARSPEFPELHDNAYRLRAGVDVLMPGSMSHVLNLRSRPRDITRAELQRTARRVLTYLLLRKA